MRRPGALDQAFGALLAEQTAELSGQRDALRQERDRLLAERDSLSRTLCESERSTFLPFVRALANRWKSPDIAPQGVPRSVDDPVYGRIALDAKLATIVAHPIFQRLGHIKQLSFSHLEYPSAAHTRLSHSLGTAKNAELALRGIFERGCYYVQGEQEPRAIEDTADQIQGIVGKAKLMALLHDIGHGPFGHALDNYIGFRDIASSNSKPDTKYTALYIQNVLAKTLRSQGLDPDDLTSSLSRKNHVNLDGWNHLIADVIDSSLDVDRMDYLVRDAHMSGLTMGFTNTMALIDTMRPVMDQGRLILTYDESALGYIEHFLLARESMFFNCYEHPRKKAAERIFTKLVNELLENAAFGLTPGDLYALTDDEILTVIQALNHGSVTMTKLAAELASGVEYVVAHEVRSGATPWVPVNDWLDQALAGKPEELSRNVRELMARVKYVTVGGDLPSELKPWVDAVILNKPAQLKLAYVTQPTVWEEAIAAQSIGPERAWQVQVVVPAHEVYLQQQSSTKLLTKESGGFKVVSLFDKSLVMKEVLEHFNMRRARIRVMVPARLSADEQSAVKRAAMDVLGR